MRGSAPSRAVLRWPPPGSGLMAACWQGRLRGGRSPQQLLCSRAGLCLVGWVAAGGRTVLASQVPVFGSLAAPCHARGLELSVCRLRVLPALSEVPRSSLGVTGAGL